MAQSKPKISIITTCKNGARFLRETIESIMNQTFTDYEHVLVDGGSTDDTIKILREYKHIRWISEPDSDANEGFQKALSMARGEYVMICCVSDGYLSQNWFQKCVDILDNDPEVSLVYGLTQQMSEDGLLGRVWRPDLLDQPPPQKMGMLAYWLASFAFFTELTYCVRTEVYKKCFPKPDSNDFFGCNNPFLKFLYNFNSMGYLPYFLPMVASFGRIHNDSVTTSKEKIRKYTEKQYVLDIIRYRQAIFSGAVKHVFRDGASNIIKVIEAHELESLQQEMREHIRRLDDKIYFQAAFLDLCHHAKTQGSHLVL